MNIKVMAQRSDNGDVCDISNLTTKMSWVTEITERPGKFSFEYLYDGKVYIPEGSIITATVDGVGLFYGYVFTRSASDSDIVPITAYDQMRYLQYKDTVNMPILTSAETFAKVCKERGLKYKVVDSSAHKVAAKLHDAKSYYEMIQSAIDDTLNTKGKWYIIRDNFGVLEHLDVENLLTPLIIGDKSLVTGFDFDSTIDDETYNQVKLTKDNKETAKREVYVVYDSANIAKWGILQYHERVSEDMNEAQIKERADMILALKNRPERSLSITCIGDKRVRAGNSVILSIEALKRENVPYNQSALVMACEHNFEDGIHTMDLDIILT